MRELASVVVFLIAVAAGECVALSVCSGLVFMNRVRVEPGNLVLADLLSSETCPDLREEAGRVGLGAAPQAGTVRVLNGADLRRLAARFQPSEGSESGLGKIPERVEIRLAAATKSCEEIAQVIASAGLAHHADLLPDEPPWTRDDARRWSQTLDCSGARHIPQRAALELRKSGFQPASRRWEFVLRCVQPQECGPFLVWSRSKPGGQADQPGAASAVPGKDLPVPAQASVPVIRKGESAMLVWDQGGIRVVVPVTCLDQGSLGQLVRARIKNADRILWAEVAGAGSLRVGF